MVYPGYQSSNLSRNSARVSLSQSLPRLHACDERGAPKSSHNGHKLTTRRLDARLYEQNTFAPTTYSYIKAQLDDAESQIPPGPILP
mmetsp:Transcript_58749/g.103892  ORF Transcript_58749/g.103892 Transcript_58749/m.103892 type:complete len:87 (+) Transcript_58749:43-303(+)